MRVRIEFGRFERRYTRNKKNIVTLNVHTDAQAHTDTRTHSARERDTMLITTWKIPHAILLLLFFFCTATANVRNRDANGEQRKRRKKIEMKCEDGIRCRPFFLICLNSSLQIL